MKIIKYCDHKNHFDQSPHIQIGTLEYYREHDNKFIADIDEGCGGQWVLSPKDGPRAYSREFIEAVSLGALQGTGVDVQEGGRVCINSSFVMPNVYVFCCSIEQEGCENTASSLGYDRWYEICDPERFSREVSQSFQNTARLRCSESVQVHSTILHGSVTYGVGRGTEHEDEFNLLAKLLFTKSPHSPTHTEIDFSRNNEYRFVWLFWKPIMKNRKRVIEVQKEPIYVPISSGIRGCLR